MEYDTIITVENVGELRELLAKLPAELPVAFHTNSGHDILTICALPELGVEFASKSNPVMR